MIVVKPMCVSGTKQGRLGLLLGAARGPRLCGFENGARQDFCLQDRYERLRDRGLVMRI